jgi:hypothetical protein
MGEAKRRSELGLPPRLKQGPGTGAEGSPRIYPWLPLSRDQAERFMQLTTSGAWVGIGALVVFWLTVRFIGPAAGWWTLADSP